MNRTKTSYLIGLVVLIVIVATGFWIMKSSKPSDEVAQPTSITFQGSEIKEEKDGQLLWSLNAKEIQVDPTTKAVTVVAPDVIFHHDGKTMELKADKGTMSADHQHMTIEGKVEGKSSTGARFTTPIIEYDGKAKSLTALKGFRYEDDRIILVGDSLRTDVVAQTLSVTGHVRMDKK